MKILEQATARELEISQVKLAIAETDAGIIRMEAALAAMRQKQTARRCEVVRQETLARCSNGQLTDGGPFVTPELPSRVAGPPFGAASGSA